MHFLSTLRTLVSALLLCSSAASYLTSCPGPKHDHYTRDQQLAVCSLTPPPLLPLSTLPPVSNGMSLRGIFLAQGTQNYTCGNISSTPLTNGAKADLYDISCLVMGSNGLSDIQALPSRILKTPSIRIKSYLKSSGSHDFINSTTPRFDLYDSPVISATKVASQPAPTMATNDQNGPAIDWLKLARKRIERRGVVEEIYRVNTAGGRAPANCTQAGELTIDYVAEYWMYG
jgi:Protein of unknown function (DUF3455)